ncbi:creatininase family protein [Halobacteriaceae archaeon GCM10025711]
MPVVPGGYSNVSWAGRTAPEIRDTATTPGSVLVVPVGSVEQHGHHLPVATDTLLADAVATAAADQVADDAPVLVAPPVSTGYSPHHLSFGGTITGEFDDRLTTLTSIADSALENGFAALLFVNGHGGNRALVDAAVSEVGKDHPDVEVLGLTYFDLAADEADGIRKSETGGMAHAGEFEASLLLHLAPDLVRDDRPATPFDEPYEWAGSDLLEGGPLFAYRDFEEYSESGAIGDTEVASAETGEQLFAVVVDELAEVLRAIHARNA